MNTLLGNVALHRPVQDLGCFLLVNAHVQSRHTHLLSQPLKGDVTQAVIPDRARLTTQLQRGEHSFEALLEIDDMHVLLRWWKAGGWVCVSGPAEHGTRQLLQEIAARVPAADEPRQARVTFTDAKSGGRTVTLDVTPWEEITGQYPQDVVRVLDQLMAHRPDSAVEARRLILWHGPPGTGKTSAIRSLVHAWRGWADTVVVTDPLVLLSDGSYLRDAVLDNQEDERWLLVVLEDAEALLHKGTGGAGLSKLLNLCDGLLGQGLRCLFLITTNEPLDAVHPALVRPGRCLARVEFGALPPAQAAALLGRQVDRAMTLAEVMAAGPLSVVHEPVAVGQYL